MKKFSACIEMLYTEAPFLERIRLAASQGFPGIEFWNWETPEKNLKEIGVLVRELGLSIAAFCVNSPQGDVRGSLVKSVTSSRIPAGADRSCFPPGPPGKAWPIAL
ncbi:MAG: hypothetical protein HYY08_03850 [Firmicutes bacterium]|nr:hypothetical protein [Bacillota bacterium]